MPCLDAHSDKIYLFDLLKRYQRIVKISNTRDLSRTRVLFKIKNANLTNSINNIAFVSLSRLCAFISVPVVIPEILSPF